MKRFLPYQIIAIVLFIYPHLRAQTKFDYLSHVGLISLQDDGTVCLLIRNPNLSVGTKFIIVFPSVLGISDHPKLMNGEVIGPKKDVCNFSESAEQGDSSYFVKIVQDTLLKHNPYFAVFISPEILEIKGNEVVGDLDGDGNLEYFRQCTSHEGVHLTIWSGKPLKGTRCWHRYFYLGYDVDPTCNEADYSEH